MFFWVLKTKTKKLAYKKQLLFRMLEVSETRAAILQAGEAKEGA